MSSRLLTKLHNLWTKKNASLIHLTNMNSKESNIFAVTFFNHIVSLPEPTQIYIHPLKSDKIDVPCC